MKRFRRIVRIDKTGEERCDDGGDRILKIGEIGNVAERSKEEIAERAETVVVVVGLHQFCKYSDNVVGIVAVAIFI